MLKVAVSNIIVGLSSLEIPIAHLMMLVKCYSWGAYPCTRDLIVRFLRSADARSSLCMVDADLL